MIIPIFKLGKMRLRQIIYKLPKVSGPLSSKSRFSQLYYAAEKEHGELIQINASKETCGSDLYFCRLQKIASLTHSILCNSY